ncbi:MAG: hypothetical protein ACLQGP_24690 [Isosphaeraceae bacterium]
MNAVFSGRVSAGWAWNACSLPTFHLHQTEYPEIESEGRTRAETCDRLLDFLVRVIEFACQVPKRPPLRLALVEVRAFDLRNMNQV